jgi:hypothetical protein
MIRPVTDQLPGTTTDYYAAWNCVEVLEAEGSAGITWSAREAPMVQLGGNWADYVSQAHHGVEPFGFDNEFVKDSEGFRKAHIYSYLMTNNFGTNFAVSQPGVVFSSYSFTTYAAQAAEDCRETGEELRFPLHYAVVQGRQKGPLPNSGGFYSHEGTGIILTTIKQAEDGDGLILRLLETRGEAEEINVTLPHTTFARAVQTNVVEEGERQLSCHGNTFSVRVAPWSLATVRLER